MRLTLQVNGAKHEVVLDDPDTPLIFVLREMLGLTGAKFACLEGACGACTVHLDGAAARACMRRARDLEGVAITTIEGLGASGLHPVQKAWIEERVAQCGYCQAGQLMQAAAFLRRSPTPDAEAIARAMSGNLCRCGTGPRIAKAVARAAEIAKEDA
ncbi:MAG: (2Fe-2S)-binding protein [Neomegalonema sp.]|nr:(2Fe-2S)-binding protein [Neomegalonema sp.]